MGGCVLAFLLCSSLFATTLANRKSLSFGISVPHTWDTAENNQSIYSTATSHLLDAAGLATEFITAHVSFPQYSSFTIRPDSYTDNATGVSHIYARQIVNGLEVVDGNMNINVKGGEVLSFGTSFYNGSKSPISPIEAFNIDDAHYADAQYDEQVALNTDYPNGLRAILGGEAVRHSVKAALAQFISLATPSQDVSSHIMQSWDQIINEMSVTYSAESFTKHRSIFIIDNVLDTVSPVTAFLAYATRKDSLELVWKYEVQMQANWYEAAMSVQPPYQLISVADWVFDSSFNHFQERAAYKVFALGVNDPTEGNRTLILEHQDSFASPFGWHSLPYANDPSVALPLPEGRFLRNTTTTWGNNVFAQENWEAKDWGVYRNWTNHRRPEGGQGGPHRVFDFEYNPKPENKSNASLEARAYVNATITQLFYTANIIHDLYYRYGFNEVAGNFQQYNFGRGGKENDAVIALAQDGYGHNNATFATPPDGRNPWCSMFLWNKTYPWRDGTFDEGVLVHELTHGLSNRLTGGPGDSSCLNDQESRGLGEGWSDFLALLIRSKKGFTDYPIAAWATNKSSGQRIYPYSLNMTTNPLTYDYLSNYVFVTDPHNIGELWAEMLWVTAQALIAKHGFREDLFPPSPSPDGTVPRGDFYRLDKADSYVPKHGNTLAMQLVINGMKLQPCRPSFCQARNAIIQADKLLTGGENVCLLWEAFASRGLGVDAHYVRLPGEGQKNGFDVPQACK